MDYLNRMIGKEVNFGNVDGYVLKGILLEINQHGFVFRLTSHHMDGDDIYFVSHSKGVKFKLCKPAKKAF